MVKDIHVGRYMVMKTKLKKTWENKFKLFGHAIDHALHCSKIVTIDSHKLPNK